MTTSGSGGGSRGCLAEWEREWGYGRLSLRKITCLAQKFCLFIILTSSRHELRFLQFFFNFPPHVAAFFSEEFVHSQTKCEARHKTSSGAPAPWAHMLPTRRQRLRRPVNRNQELGAGTWQLGPGKRAEIIRCILITIQINGLIVFIPSSRRPCLAIHSGLLRRV